MRRRSVIGTIAGGFVGIAGCSGDSGEGTDAPGGEGTASTTNDGRAAGQVAVALEPYEYHVVALPARLTGEFDEEDVVPAEDVAPELRDALLEARDGGYETDSVSQALLAGIDEFRNYNNIQIDPYVRLGGTSYVFDPTVPTFAAELADETLETYDEERTVEYDRDFESEAVDRFVHALSVTGTMTARAEYRVCVRPDSVEEFLENYDSVEDPEGVSRIETTWENEDPPYSIDVREVRDEDLYGRPVVDASARAEDLGDFLDTTVDSRHHSHLTPADTAVYLTDEVPQSYFEDIRPDDEGEDAPYVRVDGTVYRFVVNDVDHEAVPVDVGLAEESSADGGSGFTLAIEGRSGGPGTDVADGTDVRVQDLGAVPPPLWLADGAERHLLDSDRYDRERIESLVEVAAGEFDTEQYVTESITVGETLSATYTVPSAVPAGEYVSRGLFGVLWEDPTTDVREDAEPYPFRLAVTVSES